MVCEQSLSFLRLRPGPCEKLKEFAIERRTIDAFLFLITMSSINIRLFSGQEYYWCWYLNLKYFSTSEYYTKRVLTEQIVPVRDLLDSLNSFKTSSVPFVTFPKQGREMQAVVLRRVGFLAYSCPKQGQDFKPLARHPYTQTWVKYPPPGVRWHDHGLEL